MHCVYLSCPIALNHYSSRYYESTHLVEDSGGWFDDQRAAVSNDNASGYTIGPIAESTW